MTLRGFIYAAVTASLAIRAATRRSTIELSR